MKKFEECVASGKHAGTIQNDLEFGRKLGVRSTPTFFVNGQIINGALPIESFAEIIDEEMELARK